MKLSEHLFFRDSVRQALYSFFSNNPCVCFSFLETEEVVKFSEVNCQFELPVCLKIYYILYTTENMYILSISLKYFLIEK